MSQLTGGREALERLVPCLRSTDTMLFDFGGRSLRRFTASSVRVSRPGGGHSLLVTCHDVHARWEAEQAASAARAQAQALVDNSPAAITLLDADLTFRGLNRAAEQVLGVSREQLLGTHVLTTVHPDVAAERAAVFEQLRTGVLDVALSEQPFVRADGEQRLLRVSTRAVRDPDETLVGFVGHLTDITDEQRRHDRLHRQARVGTLTGLANRVLLLERADAVLAAAPHSETAMVFIDLDGLKRVNDRHGHAAGDQLLIEAGRRICATVRPGDTVARLGGDEFVVLLEQPVVDLDPLGICDRLRTALAAPLVGHGWQPEGGSVGIAFAHVGESAAGLLARADAAMYADKVRRKQPSSRHEEAAASLGTRAS